MISLSSTLGIPLTFPLSIPLMIPLRTSLRLPLTFPLGFPITIPPIPLRSPLSSPLIFPLTFPPRFPLTIPQFPSRFPQFLPHLSPQVPPHISPDSPHDSPSFPSVPPSRPLLLLSSSADPDAVTLSRQLRALLRTRPAGLSLFQLRAAYSATYRRPLPIGSAASARLRLRQLPGAPLRLRGCGVQMRVLPPGGGEDSEREMEEGTPRAASPNRDRTPPATPRVGSPRVSPACGTPPLIEVAPVLAAPMWGRLKWPQVLSRQQKWPQILSRPPQRPQPLSPPVLGPSGVPKS
ncbi:proline-rich protein 36-like isoform X1 [Ammospiza caudacuta]|uniref:proline-rich protein 36-like isoform X1 n=1 Tax=Ammospiza caudacuta TaxID=2857398 RepID=UPI002739FCDF|nr:proline-rich protein 36-like isoform X1 [Ammospiza caudacuta]